MVYISIRKTIFPKMEISILGNSFQKRKLFFVTYLSKNRILFLENGF